MGLMNVYESLSIIIVLAAIFSYINIRFFKFPSTIGIMVIAMFVSIGVVTIGQFFPHGTNELTNLFESFNFTQMLMGIMLNFLLFAGGIHINLNDLKEQRLPIIVFATVGVIISTLVVGLGLYLILDILLPKINVHFEIPMIYCFLFGALISPTDPIAVLSLLKQTKVSKSLETKIAGESLFNDGVAVVIFSILYGLAIDPSFQETGEINLTFPNIFSLFITEAIGGVVLGLSLGYLGAYAIHTANDYKVNVLITLAIVMGGYLIAKGLHTSAPLAMVMAGLVIGDSKRKAKAEQRNVGTFWELIDEIMNAILFLFMGFELLLINNLKSYWLVGIICIIVVLLARFISIKLPVILLPFKEKFSKGTVAMLVWGGLRGGVSIALALQIPGTTAQKDFIISATYFVVVFSILIQGLTIGKLAKRIKKEENKIQQENMKNMESVENIKMNQ